MRHRLSYANVVATLALFVALGGSATAAKLVTSRDIRDRTIQVRDLSAAARKALTARPGPAGPAGAPGSQGPAGPPGPGTNYSIVAGDTRAVSTASGKNDDQATVRCPQGRPIAGGLAAASKGVTLSVSTESAPGEWKIRVEYNTGSSGQWTWQPVVTCAT